MDRQPRSVRIDPDERGAWTSDRPRRAGEAERPPRLPDIAVRSRVLRPSGRIRYSPGSLLLITGPDADLLEAFAERTVEERGVLLSLRALRTLIAGKVAPEDLDAKAAALRETLAAKRLASGESVVIVLPGLDPGERERWARMAAAHRRPRHVLLVEGRADDLDDEVRPELNRFRNELDGAALGQEGFATAMRLGGQAVAERRKIVFAPAPADD
jgi:hypothetical protein